MKIKTMQKILILVMVFGAFGTAQAVPSVTIDPASTTGLSRGNSFSVNVSVDPDGKGLSSGEIRLSFNTSVLEVTSLTKGDILGTRAIDPGSNYNNTAGTVITNYARVGITTPPTPEGTWATLVFRVKSGAPVGPTNIVITKANLADENFAELTGITTTNGTAIVTTVPKVTIVPATTTGVSSGSSFSVNVSVDPDGSGLSSGDIRLSFNTSILEVTSLTKGDILGTNAIDPGSNYNNTAGTVTTNYARVGVTTPPTSAGTWAKVVFKVKSGAPLGNTTIGITKANLADENFAELTGIIITNGTATVINKPTGDINGDGIVNYKDLGLLGASYGLKLGDAGFNPNADLNNDGIVNYKDLGILGSHYGEKF